MKFSFINIYIPFLSFLYLLGSKYCTISVFLASPEYKALNIGGFLLYWIFAKLSTVVPTE